MLLLLSHFSHVWLFVTPRTVAHQTPLSMVFSRQEYWSGLPFPSPEDLPNTGIKPASLRPPALAGRFFTTSATWEAHGLTYLWLGGQASQCLRRISWQKTGVMSSLSRRTLCLTSSGRMVLIPYYLPPLPLVPPSPSSLLLTEQLPVAGTVLLTDDLHVRHINQFVLSPSCTLECQELLKIQLSKKKSCPGPLQSSCFRIFEGKPFISVFFNLPKRAWCTLNTESHCFSVLPPNSDEYLQQKLHWLMAYAFQSQEIILPEMYKAQEKRSPIKGITHLVLLKEKWPQNRFEINSSENQLITPITTRSLSTQP